MHRHTATLRRLLSISLLLGALCAAAPAVAQEIADSTHTADPEPADTATKPEAPDDEAPARAAEQEAAAAGEDLASGEAAAPDRATRREREALSQRLDQKTGRGGLGQGAKPPGEEPTGYGELLIKMLVSLGVVCLLAYLALKYGLKRLIPTGDNTEKMAVLARLPLEPRRTLLVVRVGSKHLVLASSESGIQPISELTAHEAAHFLDEGARPDIPTEFTLENPESLRAHGKADGSLDEDAPEDDEHDEDRDPSDTPHSVDV